MRRPFAHLQTWLRNRWFESLSLVLNGKFSYNQVVHFELHSLTLVSFIVCAAGKCDTRQQTLDSINKLTFLEKEVFFCEKLACSKAPEGQAKNWAWPDLQNCLNLARGQYIRILEEGEVVEAALLQEQIDRLKREKKVVCLLGLAPELLRTFGLRLSGAHFLFLCLSNLLAPVKASSGLLFKNRKKSFQLEEKLNSLALSDLCFQLARSGDILFQEFHPSVPVAVPEALVEWLVIARKYSSFLRCLGSGEELVHQILAKDFLNRLGFNYLVESKFIEEDALLALKRVLFKEWEACSLLPEEGQGLWLATCQLIGQDGALVKQQQASERHYLVASLEVRTHEEKLRSLLMSRSWKYTKWLRDIRGRFAEESGAACVGGSNVEGLLSGSAYLHYLKAQINTIYSSKSWFVTRPLRVWEALSRFGDEESAL